VTERALEQELRALSQALDWPQTPDVGGAVREQVARSLPDGRRRWRRELVLAVAVLAAALAATLAVPQARSAVLRWLGLGSVRVELVDELPAAAPRESLTLLGPVLSRADAATVVGTPLLRFDPGVLGEPDEIRALDAPRQVSYLWTAGDGTRLLVSELPGSVPSGTFVKTIGPGATVEQLEVDGRRALWITGDAHGFGLVGGDFEVMRLSGNALLVDRGATTIRIEGDLTRAEAIRVYRAIE
jgi:hypothetical protein